VTIRFPGKLTRVVRASLAPPCVVLEELEEMTNPSVATLTWPDFPEMQTGRPLGPLDLMGVDPKGELLLWKEEVSAAEVTAVLRGHEMGLGYLTIMQGSFALYDVMTDDYVWLDSVLHPRNFPVRVNHGHQTLERTQRSWFVDPSKGPGPLKTKPLPRPYELQQCWLGANGQALFDVRVLIALLNNHAGLIGDPYAWRTKTEPQGIHTMPVQQDTSTRFLVVGEES
jgi:hypothetical protein